MFCEIHPPDHFPILFYREPKAPDMNLRSDELDLAAITAARIFWTTGTGLSDEPSRSATLDALDARAGNGLATIHDLDYRRHVLGNPVRGGTMAAGGAGAGDHRHRQPGGVRSGGRRRLT